METGTSNGLGIMVAVVIMSIMLGLVSGWNNILVESAIVFTQHNVPGSMVDDALPPLPPLPEESPILPEESGESEDEELVADEDADYYIIDGNGKCKNGKGRSPGNGKPGNCSQNGLGHNNNGNGNNGNGNGNKGNNGNGNNGNNGNGNNGKGNGNNGNG